MRLKNGVVFRFEPLIRSGTCFVFDLHSGRMLPSDCNGLAVLEQPKAGPSLEDMAARAGVLAPSAAALLNELRDRGLLVGEP